MHYNIINYTLKLHITTLHYNTQHHTLLHYTYLLYTTPNYNAVQHCPVLWYTAQFSNVVEPTALYNWLLFPSRIGTQAHRETAASSSSNVENIKIYLIQVSQNLYFLICFLSKIHKNIHIFAIQIRCTSVKIPFNDFKSSFYFTLFLYFFNQNIIWKGW